MMVGDLSAPATAQLATQTAKQFLLLWSELQSSNPELAKKTLKARCRNDRVLFASYFFGEKLKYEFSPFHLACLRAPKTAFSEREPGSGWRRAVMGPRGNGKSAVWVKADVVHDIVYGFERFIAILAEQHRLSESRLREIRVELEQNRKLRDFFGDLVGEVWRTNDIETANGVRLMAAALNSQVRGIKHPVTDERPTKYILDDFENSKRALNPELREMDLKTFREDVDAGGWPDGRTCYQMTGTPLHREAILPGLRRNPGWEFRAFPAIQKWPERMDLWEKARDIFGSAGEPDAQDDGRLDFQGAQGTELATRFYRANQKAMDQGAEVLWPQGEPLLQLMLWRWTNGEAAFSKEKMLEPRDPSTATFDMDLARRHELGEDQHGRYLEIPSGSKVRKVRLKNCRIVVYHDPAKADPTSKKKTRVSGDYAALVTMAVETKPDGGRFGHVIDAWMSREARVSLQVERAFELADLWQAERILLEEHVLGLLKESYRKERKRRGARVSLYAIEHQATNKDARIASMEPAISNGWLTFNRAVSPVFWNQFVDHPTGDHDDGPDATEGAWRHSRRSRAGLTQI